MDAVKALDQLRGAALPTSKGRCATHVRLALRAGGVEIDPHPVSAKEYGPFLVEYGFRAVDVADAKADSGALAGDVCVIQDCAGHPHGHIAMYDGERWISDFVQRDIWAGPKFRALRPPLQVYRAGPAAAAIRSAAFAAGPKPSRSRRPSRGSAG